MVTFATATPIANSVTEAYVMQRYLRPDLLEAAGIEVFDTWAATFGQVVSQVELAPEGGSNFRMKTRFARFANVPEMLRMLHVAADVKTAEDLALPVPDLKPRDDGQRAPEIVTVEPSDELLDYVRDLGDRAEKVRSRAVDPDEDNMLKISRRRPPRRAGPAAGRPAADDPGQDQRGRRPDRRDLADAPGRRVLRPRTASAYPVRGSLQLVFCDLGTPGPGWNAYDELRGTARRPRPAPRGGPVHPRGQDRPGQGPAVRRLPRRAGRRPGRVDREDGRRHQRPGPGHRPAPPGRAVAARRRRPARRPHPAAGQPQPRRSQIIRYVTERSFDGYMWQTLERKATFIGQVMHGRLDTREISDIGDTALSFSEVKALATGNPLLMDKAEADAALARLQRAERACLRNQDALRHAIGDYEAEISRLTVFADAARHRDRPAAGHPRRELHHDRRPGPPRQARRRRTARQGPARPRDRRAARASRPHGTAGLSRRLPAHRLNRSLPGQHHAVLDLDGVPGSAVRLSAADIRAADPAGLITRIENRLHRLEARKQEDLGHINQARREIAHARHSLGQPFPQAAQLAEARATARRIDDQLDQIVADSQRKDPEPEPRPAPGVPGKAAEAGQDSAAGPDWRDQVIRSGADRWMPVPVRPLDAGAGRSAEHGSPEPGR